MPYTPPIRHSSSPSSSSSSASSYSYSTPPSPASSFSSSAVSVDANRTPERSLPIPSAPHHALHTLTFLCAEAMGARTLQDTHTEKSNVAAGAPITPPPRQVVKHQYRGITTITPASINQDRHFLGRKDKTSTELRQLANWLLHSNCSQAGVGFDVKDQKTSSDDCWSSFSTGVLGRRLRASQGGCGGGLLPAHFIGEHQSFPSNSQDKVDQWRGARERRKFTDPVRPAIHPCVHRRSASAPTSPKAVHFGPVLEDVRFFNQAERPIAVSAGSSPIMDRSSCHFSLLPQELGPYEWELSTPNLPRSRVSQETAPVRLYRVYLSNDSMNLLGTVVVANLAYHKSVVCRFTMDFWNTISEVTAQHCREIEGYDVFKFTVGLAELVDLEMKPMFLCVRYNVNGQEFWDNNSSLNVQLDFRKRPLR
ncbi:CBM21 domain-containing protein [Fusarium falciforme]|uniref:CBM21 domain-containing protein n=1 Tax=Fusarium falciforme TaxID=195108 RepID=UPI0022FFDAEC|nr:CBM21 domain-containing protein [Fusarium falciforme]WAO95486.1 CBM21 domain-containing protein [Fusarium falciforme]